MTFGQIFASIASLVTLLSLVDELRRVKAADWAAFFKSEPLPSSTEAGSDPALPTSSPFPVTSVNDHGKDVIDRLPLAHGGGLGGPIDIQQSLSDQVANDLRTEPCYVDQDIFYDWVPVDNKLPTKKSPGPSITKKAATKLMTWKNANAYKEIPVPLPYGVREGQRWRLVLSAVPAASAPSGGVPASARIPSSQIYLDEDTIGKWNPFPVSSMPVTFTANAKSVKGAPKQEQIERTYEFRVLTSESSTTGESVTVLPSRTSGQELVNQLKGLQVEDDSESKAVRLVIREQTSFDLDKKIWDSGIGLSSWIVQVLNRRLSEPEVPSEAKLPGEVDPLDWLKRVLTSSSPLRILELESLFSGAGTGIVALILAALRSRIADAEDSILTTDLDSAIPLLQHNIDANESTRSSRVSLKAGVLDWDQTVSEQLPSQDGDSSIDLVVCVRPPLLPL
ncbi:hypothetical protein H1R20_g2737, partial [Candolleomyces eurysporus]